MHTAGGGSRLPSWASAWAVVGVLAFGCEANKREAWLGLEGSPVEAAGVDGKGRAGATGDTSAGGPRAGPVEASGNAAAMLPDAGVPMGIVAEPADAAAFIYDESQLRTYELTLNPTDLEFLDANPPAEEYVEGMLAFEGQAYGPVGIRYKGSAGAFRFSGCVGEDGRKACTKLSIKVSFDWRDPDGRFHGLRKLQFHAMPLDPSMLQERLGYWVFRQFGLAAPRAVHAALRINGQFVGLFVLVEQIDGRFTRSRFVEGGEGNLYKEAWPLASDRTAITESALRPRLETNEDDNPALATMLSFAAELERAELIELPAVLQRFTDLDHALHYAAVDRTIAVDDGPFHWYGGGASAWNHNYYWYEESKREHLWLIPWDLDSSFNLDNPTTTIWMPWDDTSLDCSGRVQPPFMLSLRLPACDKIMLGWASMQQRYLDLVRQLLAGPLSPTVIEPKLTEWENQIEPIVAQAAGLHADAVSVEMWRQGRSALRWRIETLRQRAQMRLAQGARVIQDPWLLDAGTPDAAVPEAGASDAGTLDAGALDGSALDEAFPEPEPEPETDAGTDARRRGRASPRVRR